MKSRGFLFLFGFVLGLSAGFLLAQDNFRHELTSALGKVATSADKQIRQLIERSKKGSGASEASDSRSPVQQASPAPRVLPDKNQYIRESVQLTGVEAKIDSGQGNPAVISGRIRNSGDLPLKRVAITVYFMSENEIVFDKNILIVNGAQLAGRAEHPFNARVEVVPRQWTGGQVRAAVTEIAFAD